MSFFGDIARGFIGAVRGFAGEPVAAAPVAAPVRAVTALTPVARTFPAPGPVSGPRQLQAQALAAVRGRRSLPHPGPIDPVAGAHVHMGGGRGGGNGLVARQTVVQTVDLQTGLLLRQEVFSGAPFLMNSDVRKLRSISKKVTKAHSKLPRRTVKESKLKQLSDAAVDEALRKVGGPSCPPKC